MFAPRPAGSTQRRPALPGNVQRRRIERAVHDPHGASERFDPAFVLGMQCQACGKLGTSPRSEVQEAVRAHAESCPARHRVSAVAVRVYYPKQ
jgi:hypothetical protein